MKITLELENEKGKVTTKEFESVRLKGRAFKQVLEIKDKISKKTEGEFAEEDIDELVKVVLIVFGNKFTYDEFYDGVFAEDILPLCRQAQEEVGKRVQSKMNVIVKN